MVREFVLNPIIKATGFSQSEACYVSSMLFCFINGFIFRTLFGIDRVTSTTRHYVSIISGVSVLLFCFGGETIHLIILTGVGLTLVHFIDRKHVHKYVFAYALLHNFTVHLLQMFYGKDAAIDITAPMMFATLRMVYVGYAFYEGFDGLKKDKASVDENENKTSREFPTTLEVISYMFFFGSILVGPPSDFRSYKRFIDGTDIKRNPLNNSLPSPTIAALTKFVLSILMACGYLFCESKDISPSFYTDEEFLSKFPFWKKLLYSEYIVCWIKFKYYSVFFLAEACVNMAGFGFNGYDKYGNALWDGLICVRPIEFEKSTSMKDVTGNWNIQTAVWLRECVYTRSTNLPMFATFFVSSVWHGALLGYYVFLISLGVVLYPQRVIRKKLIPVLENSTAIWLYWFCSFLATRLLKQYLNSAFVLRNMYSTWRYWTSIYFYGHWLILLYYVIMYVLPDYTRQETRHKTRHRTQNETSKMKDE